MPYEIYGLIRESYNINSDLELSICFVLYSIPITLDIFAYIYG